jgi:hypothetical protein
MVVLHAAESAYHRLQATGQSLSNVAIRRELLEASVEGILGHAVFNAKRHDLRETLKWSTDDQQGFEQQLCREVAERMTTAFDRICAGERPRRVPRRRTPREEFTLEKLHAPLPIIR